jgi:hypothetical protein
MKTIRLGVLAKNIFEFNKSAINQVLVTIIATIVYVSTTNKKDI